MHRPRRCTRTGGLEYVCLAGLLAACGGSRAPPPPPPDFAISASSSAVSVAVGATSAPITVSVSAVNAFTGTVSVTVSGLPGGATTNPAFPLTVTATQSQSFTVTLPATASVGTSTVTLHGSSGSLSHDAAPFTIDTVAAIQTSQSGSVLYLQSTANGHTARIGLETQWGGSIVEVSLDGTNFVNAHDTGREVQPALYDLAGGQGANGWDPVLGGDKYDRGSPMLGQQLSANALDTQATPLYWNPDAFGGGANAPVRSDTTFEQVVTTAPGAPLAFKVHLKLTHTGSDYHYVTTQEFPAVYVNSAYTNLVTYGGQAPWTNGALTTTPITTTALSVFAPEQWAALVDANRQGLTVFVPGTYPSWTSVYFTQSGGSGPHGDATAYMRPVSEFAVPPGAVIEGDVYLIPGDVDAARAVVNALHPSATPASLAAPFGTIDAPAASATVSGASYAVQGWALAGLGVAAVNVYVDGTAAGSASLGVARPDVQAAYPAIAPADSGWQYALDTTRFANGTHTVAIHVVDSAQTDVALPPVSVTVQN